MWIPSGKSVAQNRLDIILSWTWELLLDLGLNSEACCGYKNRNTLTSVTHILKKWLEQ